ncbi:Gluconate utilization system GNT-I transcriptional repressor [Serratia fonticola]|uniref:Gluconate utilization system GNT-I transcriptional repressor n=1 Tax=Serratia fonticola TaxID=47917 RepID=A0A4U9VSG7_SERFO|nr:Gluconate utilization system GNT-I transcriptional repressor [Serratia fonticola]
MSIGRKRRSTGRVTLADVAQLAGVGTMTVSRALRTPEQVSDKLREKIESAVSELGYLPNLAASSLASASSYTIAMVVPSFFRVRLCGYVCRVTAGTATGGLPDHASRVPTSYRA